MSHQSLSPLDGRYRSKLGALPALMSEHGYMQRRVQVELAWLGELLRSLPDAPRLGAQALAALEAISAGYDDTSTDGIKAIEKTTNHDVKAVEYWLKDQLASDQLASDQLPAAVRTELKGAAEYIHFACTSEDINNTSHALQLQAARAQVLLPSLNALQAALAQHIEHLADTPMLSRTHGQTATPTTLGKEFANVLIRLQTGQTALEAAPIKAKMNGAVGNYNAHTVAYPEVDWPALSRRVVEGLGLEFQPYSTQIEPHDYMAAYFDALARINTVLLGFSRDVWGYVSLGYFKQKLKDGEVGSSTMPHKVNPIDFENAEGNLGLANALLRHMSEKLPISRWQRDLSDSTVLRNMGVALGYAQLAYQSLLTGLAKLEVNHAALQADLDSAWEVLAEPIQTVMRRYGYDDPYKTLKEKTRGKAITATELREFIAGLELPAEAKARLLALTPSSYMGLAERLARGVLA